MVTSLNETQELDEAEQMIQNFMGQDADAADGDPVHPQGQNFMRTDSFSHAFDQFTGGEDGYDPVELKMSGSTKEFYLHALGQKDRQS